MAAVDDVTIADPDIRLGRANLICFPVSHVLFFAGVEPKSIAKLHGGVAGFYLWIRHWMVSRFVGSERDKRKKRNQDRICTCLDKER